jgi:Uma2 family endonuclease
MGLPHDPVTVEDLEQLPDNGMRHELLDGRIVMTPPPGVRHNLAVDYLHGVLREAAQGRGWRTLQNQGVYLGEDMIVPDLTVYPEDAPIIRDCYILGGDALLVVEVVSPSSRKDDRFTKPAKCAAFGVPLYLLVDPTVSPLTAALYVLSGRKYEQVTEVKAGEPLMLPQPFDLTIDTGRLAD